MRKKICTDGRLDNSSLFSAEAVVSNEDLIREIFLRLPVRSLIRFKLVSKRWDSLISDPQFACDRTCRLNPNSVVPSGLYFYNSLTNSQEIESVSLDDSPIQLSRVRVPSLSFLHAAAAGSRVTILQSCNGLLLCEFASQCGNEYCVCNPSTNSYKILPKPCLNPRAYGFALAFDPSIAPHFKVVCCNTGSDMNYRKVIQIYSSETGKWSTSTNCSDLPYAPLGRSGIHCNGSVHWITRSGCVYYRYKYDLDKDNFKEFDIPRTPRGYYNRGLRYFGESRGRLHLVYVQSRSAKKFRVLESDRETMRWSVKYRVHLCHLLSKFPEICVKISRANMYAKAEYAFSVLSVLMGEKEEDSALVLTIPGKVISYNLHYKTSKVLCELASQVIDTSYYHFITGFNFIETLALV